MRKAGVLPKSGQKSKEAVIAKRNPSNKKMNTGKKNIAVDKTSKDVVLNNSIQSLMKTNLLAYMEELSKDSGRFFEFFDDLPGSVRASLLTQFIPKVKDTDSDLKQSMLSLTESFAHLPSVDDLTKRLRILTLEINRLEIELEEKSLFIEQLESKMEEWVNSVYKSLPTTSEDFNRRNRKCFFGLMLDQYNKLHDAYAEVMRRNESTVLSRGEYESRLVGGYEIEDSPYK